MVNMREKTVFRRAMIAVGISAGLLFAGAPAALADDTARDSFRVNHDNRGLGGTVTVFKADGGRYDLPVGQYLSGGEYNSINHRGSMPRYVQAGSGYCVWEELFYKPATSQGYTKIDDFNWGKSVSTRKHELRGYYLAANTEQSRAYWSKLNIYAC